MSDKEWTFAIGIRRAVLHLMIWSLICAAVWIAAVHFSAPILNRFSMRVFLIPSAALGAGMGWLLVRNLSESAGFAGWVLILMAAAAAIAVLLGGIAAVGTWQPLHDTVPFAVGGPATVAAVVVIVMRSLQDM